MKNRYDSLDVSLNVDRSDKQRLNQTIQVSSRGDEESSKGENDEKVNKFKELYFKNQKLRKELKLLNEKLNQKLQKLKLPSVKKKAQSVDLNHVPPSKALQRELENAYKQVAMYKKQIEGLKSKQQTPQNYDKLRNSENMIGYMDMEINQVQEQLKSIKNVKKLQERVLSEDVENAELKQRLAEYQTEVKNFKQKLRDIDRKSRKREQDFKKQQAYLVALEAKLRKSQAEQREQERPQPQKPQQASEQQFAMIRDEIKFCKFEHEQLCKKLDTLKKNLRHTREQKVKLDQKLVEREAVYKQLCIQAQSYARLLKDLQIKKYEQTGVREQNRDIVNKMLKLEEIEDEPENASLSQSKQDMEFSKLASSTPAPAASKPMSQEREWKGKMRKVSMGYMTPTDESFQQSGKLLGLKVYFDQNRFICGLAAVMVVNGYRVQSKVQGVFNSSELKWEVPMGDEIGRITGSFTQQGYLGQIVLTSWKGLSNRFGSSYADAFQFNLDSGESFTGLFGGFRRLGQDVRITQIGFWISKG